MAPSKAVTKFSDGSGFRALVASADTDGFLEALTENVGGESMSEFDIDRVKVPTGGSTTWEVPTFDGEKSTKEISGIIVKWFSRRAYWPGKFGGGNEPPQCASTDGKIGVGEPGGDCLECPFAQFGSSENEESPNAQACKAFRLLFVLTPDALLPTVLVIPATSLKSSRQYMLKLASAGVPHTGVVTKFTLEKDKSNSGIEYSKVNMTPGERLSPEARAKVIDYARALMPTFEAVAVTRSDIVGDDSPKSGQEDEPEADF